MNMMDVGVGLFLGGFTGFLITSFIYEIRRA